MAIIHIEGFKVYLGLDGKRSIIVNSACIDECMRVYTDHALDGVAITIAHDYKLANVDFLEHYPEITSLSISQGIEDISAIHNLGNLKWLIASGRNRKIDFSFFPFMEDLRIEWSSKLVNLKSCTKLEGLFLRNYNPKVNDASNIKDIAWIRRLGVVQSTIQSLNGLEEMDRLEEVEIDYCSKLTDIGFFTQSKNTLISLLFGNCKAIINYQDVACLSNLKTLAFNDCGRMESIGFIKDMRSLKSFRFVNTDVLDGDMNPCIGLEYVAFSNKKHFSHKLEGIRELNKTMRS
jgi:protein phosphatase 1 regulatory subunit 7